MLDILDIVHVEALSFTHIIEDGRVELFFFEEVEDSSEASSCT